MTQLREIYFIYSSKMITPSVPPPEDGRCQIMGPFSLIVQGSLGLMAMSSLVYKRYREYPNRRSWLIWFYDVSKQVFGSFGLHVLNVFMSLLKANDESLPNGEYYRNFQHGRTPIPPISDSNNPCNWYFLNILFDTTLGIPILWCFLYVIFHSGTRAGITDITSGQYGHPPRFSAYAKQAILYFIGLLCMKLVVYIILQLVPGLVSFADFVLSWTDGIPRLQLAFTVMIFPLM